MQNFSFQNHSEPHGKNLGNFTHLLILPAAEPKTFPAPMVLRREGEGPPRRRVGSPGLPIHSWGGEGPLPEGGGFLPFPNAPVLWCRARPVPHAELGHLRLHRPQHRDGAPPARQLLERGPAAQTPCRNGSTGFVSTWHRGNISTMVHYLCIMKRCPVFFFAL